MDIDTLRSSFKGRLLTEPADMVAFLTDWRDKWTGRAVAVAQPDNTEGVAAVLRWCHANQVPVVPQGGNTGLSGGATPDAEGLALVLSLTRLNRVRQIDSVNNTIEVDAGVTLQQVQEAAREAGRLFPLSLAAQGSCTIGGNLATNAGGVQVLRYGNARALCLGLEVVTAEGEIWDGLRGLRKDNTGYDLRDLYIGSEGTLGVITRAVLQLFPLPAGQAVAFVAVPTPAAAIALLQLAQARLGSSLTAFELMSDACIGLVEKHVDAARFPLGERSDWYVLLEVSDTRGEVEAGEAIEAVLEAGHGAGARHRRGPVVQPVSVQGPVGAARRHLGSARRRGQDHQARHFVAHLPHRRVRGPDQRIPDRCIPRPAAGGVRPSGGRQPALQPVARRRPLRHRTPGRVSGARRSRSTPWCTTPWWSTKDPSRPNTAWACCDATNPPATNRLSSSS